MILIIFFIARFYIYDNSISTCINQIQNNIDAIFVLFHSSNEKVKEKINQNGHKKFTSELSANAIKLRHKIIERCIINDNTITSTPSLFIYNYKNECLLFQNFHLHPLLIKIQRNNSDFFKPFFLVSMKNCKIVL